MLQRSPIFQPHIIIKNNGRRLPNSTWESLRGTEKIARQTHVAKRSPEGLFPEGQLFKEREMENGTKHTWIEPERNAKDGI